MARFEVSYKFTTKESEFENNGYGLGYDSEFVEADNEQEAIELFKDFILDNKGLSNVEQGANYFVISNYYDHDFEKEYYFSMSAKEAE